MSSVNSAIAAFIKSTGTKELTLIDLYENKETIQVSVTFLESISDFFKNFSRYDIPLLVPVEVMVARNLLEFVQGLTPTLDQEQLYNIYKLSTIWKMDIGKDACIEKIKELNINDIMKLYAKIVNQKDVPVEFNNNIIKNMMSNINVLNKPEYIKMLQFETVIELLSREDYELNTTQHSQKNTLEDNLHYIMLMWFTYCLPDTNQENCKKFLTCWKLIRKNCLTFTSLVKTTTNVYYNIDIIKHVVAPDLVIEFINIMKDNKIGTQRNKLYELKIKTKLINTQEMNKKLKVGDTVDCMDKQGVWYVADILNIENDKFKVHFHGWKSSFDEYISNTEPKIAPIGTFTNGIKHSNDVSCNCNTCNTKKTKCTDPSCTFCKFHSQDNIINNNHISQLMDMFIHPLGFSTIPKF